MRTYSSNESLVRERRSHIVKCAIKVFYDKGYRGTTIRDLAKACGMAQGALYHYIGSKDDILHLICEMRAGGAEPLRSVLDNLRDASAANALKKCTEAWIRMEDVEAYEIVFFNREIGNFTHEDRRMLLHSQVDVQQFFEQLLTEGVKKGEFEVDSIPLVAHHLLMMGQDWPLRKWFLKNLFTLEEYIAKEIQFLMDAIATGPNLCTDTVISKKEVGAEKAISTGLVMGLETGTGGAL